MKALIQVSLLCEVDDEEEAFKLQQEVDESARTNALATLARRGATIADLQGLYEYLGTSITIVRDEVGL